MKIFSFVPFLICAALMACAPVNGPTASVAPASATQLSPRQSARNFVTVVRRMEPVVERACRDANPRRNCDFQIVVDDRPNQPPNAFQTLDENGRPILGFNLALIQDVRNVDELAFVFGHEAAHHVQGHIARQQENTVAGAIGFGILAAALGGSQASVEAAQQLGASVGARSFSKDFELEADSLGARLTQAAGFDAVKGAAYFTRIPDPGNRFLGTHPPNAARIATVRAAVGR